MPLLDFTRSPDRGPLPLPAAAVSHKLFAEGQPEGETLHCNPAWLASVSKPPSLQAAPREENLLHPQLLSCSTISSLAGFL